MRHNVLHALTLPDTVKSGASYGFLVTFLYIL